MAQDPYRLYLKFIALKMHFTNEKYNFLMYSGKTKSSYEAFQRRSDYKMFIVLANRLDQSITVPFLVSQFVDRPSVTVSSIIEQPLQAQKIYLNWKSRTEDIKQLYHSDIRTIAKEANGLWANAIIQKGNDYPLIFKMVSSKKISPETYSLLDSLFNYTTKEYSGIAGDNLFYSLNLKYKKYRMFINLSLDYLIKETPKHLSDYLIDSC